MAKNAHTTATRHQKVSTGEGRKKAEKGWECHTFQYNMAGQRLMCVFKELARSPKLGGVTAFFFQINKTVLKTSQNRTKIGLGVPLGFAVTQRGGRGLPCW